MAFPQTGSCVGGGGHSLQRSQTSTHPGQAFVEGGHQLEKLEFALAVAVTRGDHRKIADLREKIDALGGNVEEPGT